MRARTQLGLAALALALGGGCEDHGGGRPRDAGHDQLPVPDGGVPDAMVAALAIDVSVTGCTTFETPGGIPRCGGVAPMTVRMSPVGSVSFDVFRWDFGDGSAVSTERSPSHTYVLPGRYTVTLTAGGAAGSMLTSHDGFIDVAPVPLGGACQVDAQCPTGETCMCGSGHPCGPAFNAGICTDTCATLPCPASSVCADLVRSAAGDATAAAEAWRMLTCLAPCQDDGDCAAGLFCRDLPAPGDPLTWVKACYAAVPADVGAPCSDARGQLAGSLCSTGTCADLGALGTCSLDCAAGAAQCPPGTACAAFADGRKLCLRQCAAATDCDRDPLLACEPPGASGALGFTAPADKSYCAPRTCSAYSDCGPAGVCASGHCVLKR